MITHAHSSRLNRAGLAVAIIVSALATATAARAQTTVVVAENSAANGGAISTFTLGGPSTPIRRITGPLTGLSSPEQIAAERNGNLYVANSSGSITVYAPTASGNVAPLRTITGPATGLGGGVVGIAVDAAGHVFASNHYRNSPPPLRATWRHSPRSGQRASASTRPPEWRSHPTAGSTSPTAATTR